MGKRERDVVLARRRAFLMAAAATTIGCGERLPCLSPPMVCLSPMPPPCPDQRYVAFEGAATSLSPEAKTKIAFTAKFIREQGAHVLLVARVFDDGHVDAAAELHEPRLQAVHQAFGDYELLDRIQVKPLADTHELAMNGEQWLEMTGVGNPTPLSGLVLLAC